MRGEARKEKRGMGAGKMDKGNAAASKKRRVRKPNTVKGTRRGGRYPEQVKTAALADMLICRNLSEVARRHGVPESTLRSWQRALDKNGERDAFERARMDALREINYRAVRGAVLSTAYLEHRLEHAAETEALRDQMLREPDALRREKMETDLRRRRGMDDGDAARTAGTLMAVLEKSREMLREESESGEEEDLSVSIEVVR